jgi:hypothetical protein
MHLAEKDLKCPYGGRPLLEREDTFPPPKCPGRSICESCAPKTCQTAEGTAATELRSGVWFRTYGIRG